MCCIFPTPCCRFVFVSLKGSILIVQKRAINGVQPPLASVAYYLLGFETMEGCGSNGASEDAEMTFVLLKSSCLRREELLSSCFDLNCRRFVVSRLRCLWCCGGSARGHAPRRTPRARPTLVPTPVAIIAAIISGI